MLQSALIELVAYYIAKKNCFFNPNSPAYLSNNPGLITIYNNNRNFKKNEHGIIEFPTRVIGLKALKMKLKIAIRFNRSFYDFCGRNHALTTTIIQTLQNKGFKITPQLGVKEFLENARLYRKSN